jgi:ribulose-phosphate 3-epimerase
MTEIIPAILPKSFDELQEKMELVTGFVPLVQVDVLDGLFLPNKTWPYIKGGANGQGDPDFAQILKEEGGFPLWEELDFEVDLMVSNPEKVIQDWITAGAKRLIVHLESLDQNTDPVKLFEKIKKSLPVKESILYTEIGVAIAPGTSDEKLDALLDHVDFVQFMGIEKVGFQKQPFDERTIQKIIRLRSARPNVTISIDGGVNLETAPKLVAAGVNRLVVGSAIFESEDVAVTIEKFFQIAGDVVDDEGTN